MVAPPLYTVTARCADRDEGVRAVEASVEDIRKEILSRGGTFELKMAAKALTLKEEREMTAMLAQLAMEAEEGEGEESDDEDTP